jgi:hypothetical protein
VLDGLLMAALVKVYCSFFNAPYADWEAECRLCPAAITASGWGMCMEFALGHLSLAHPEWKESLAEAVPVEPPC